MPVSNRDHMSWDVQFWDKITEIFDQGNTKYFRDGAFRMELCLYIQGNLPACRASLPKTCHRPEGTGEKSYGIFHQNSQISLCPPIYKNKMTNGIWILNAQNPNLWLWPKTFLSQILKLQRLFRMLWRRKFLIVELNCGKGCATNDKILIRNVLYDRFFVIFDIINK